MLQANVQIQPCRIRQPRKETDVWTLSSTAAAGVQGKLQGDALLGDVAAPPGLLRLWREKPFQSFSATADGLGKAST